MSYENRLFNTKVGQEKSEAADSSDKRVITTAWCLPENRDRSIEAQWRGQTDAHINSQFRGEEGADSFMGKRKLSNKWCWVSRQQKVDRDTPQVMSMHF